MLRKYGFLLAFFNASDQDLTKYPLHFATLVASPTQRKGDDGRLLSPSSIAKKEENKKDERKKKKTGNIPVRKRQLGLYEFTRGLK